MLERLRKDQRVRLAAISAVLALLTLFPFLGSFGFWDPPGDQPRRGEDGQHEISVADRARSISRNGDYAGTWKTQPPLTPWLVASSTATFGRNELAARLPLALLGGLAVLATYGLGLRLRGPRAGLFSAVVLLASPLFVFQARQLTSDIGAVAGAALAMFGFAGLAWPAEKKRSTLANAGDALAVAGGLVLGQLALGLFLGVLAPVAAAAAAALPFVRRDGDAPPRMRAFAAAAGAAAAVLLIAICVQVFRVEPAQPGSRALFGMTLVGAKTYLPWVGGAWRAGEAPVTATFNWIVRQVAYGMFPWSAVAPIAVLRLAFMRGRDRASWTGVLVVAWATVSYFLACVWVRGFGDVRYPALAAIAVACGLFFDDLFAAKLERAPERLPEAGSGLPIAAVFVFMAGFILSLDIRNFPEELATVHLIGATIKFPPAVMWLVYGAIFFGIVFAGAAALGIYVPGGPGRMLRVPRETLARHGLLGALAVSYAFGLYLSWIYTPKLSEHLSTRNLFEAYLQRRTGDEALAVMGIPGSAPEYYARGRFERIDNMSKLLEFLRAPERVFAVVPSDRMCAVHQTNASMKVEYHVVDTRNSRYYLLANRLAPGEVDVNPILRAIRKEPPATVARKVEANFEDTVELFGVDMPDAVDKGESFKITLWLRVKKRFADSKQIFLHFDHPSGVRFLGDHFPVACNTQYWQPGDIIADTYEITAAPELTNPTGQYRVMMGFFVTVSAGNWKNMQVLTPTKDPDNRVPLGTLLVR